MSVNTIRILTVAANPLDLEVIQRFLDDMQDQFEKDAWKLEIVGVAYNKRTALQQFKALEPELVIVDLMLPGMRSVEVISFITGTKPDTKVVAMVPGDPPHDRLMFAIQAGVLSYFSQDAESSEVYRSIDNALRGNIYLPKDETYDVLQSAASDLIASKNEQRAQFMSALIGLLPAAGILAAFTSFLWREYWGQIGVRVTDLGVDASSRVVEFSIYILLILGAFGPLLFINTWLDMLETLFGKKQKEKLGSKLRAQVLWLFSHRTALWFICAVITLTITLPLNYTGGKILTILIGAIFAAALLGNMAGMADSLPSFFVLSLDRFRRVMALIGGLVAILMLALSVEVYVIGPDLQHDGVHGYLVKKVLDVTARPAIFYDLDEKHEPLGALYLGGNADLYVLYDPNKKRVRMIPVGSTRVEIVRSVPVTKNESE